MDRDSEICRAVAEQLARTRGWGRVTKHHAPDDPSRTRGAPDRAKFIDLEATTEDGKVVALEHTLIESYEKQLADGRQLVKLLVPLESRLAGRLPVDRVFHLSVRIGGVRDADLTAAQVAEDLVPWISETARTLPAGNRQVAPAHWASSPPGLCVSVALYAWPPQHGQGGRLLVQQVMPEDTAAAAESRVVRLRRALEDKLPKLLDHSPADVRVLVLEDQDLAMSNISDVWVGLKAAAAGFTLCDLIVVVEHKFEPTIGTVVYDAGEWLEDFRANRLPIQSLDEPA